MNTEHFNYREDKFKLHDSYDLYARFSFKTDSSISFDIVENRNYIDGWVDVHHPIEDFYQTRIKICIPEKFILLKEPKKIYSEHWQKTYIEKYDVHEMKRLSELICSKLEIDISKPYVARFILKEVEIQIQNQHEPGVMQ